VLVIGPENLTSKRLRKASSKVDCISSHVHSKPHTVVWFGGYEKQATADVNQRSPTLFNIPDFAPDRTVSPPSLHAQSQPRSWRTSPGRGREHEHILLPRVCGVQPW
jgi:hypothetical protein